MRVACCALRKTRWIAIAASGVSAFAATRPCGVPHSHGRDVGKPRADGKASAASVRAPERELFRSLKKSLPRLTNCRAKRLPTRKTNSSCGKEPPRHGIELFTIGFTRKTARAFFTSLKDAGVRRVVDVRLNNNSQLAGFSKKEDLAYFLREIGGIEYVHLPELAPTQDILDAYKKQQRRLGNLRKAIFWN